MQVAPPGMEASRCTALEAALRIAQGKSTAVKLAEACLTRIEECKKEVEAWAYIDRSQVLKQARERDTESARSPLHGVPVGVKDIIDTCDMPTEYGSSIYRGHRPQRDAAGVAMLREAGCVIMGKTVTVKLTAFHWARTRNPRELARTSGGSSSGSAAAVEDFMAFGGVWRDTAIQILVRLY